MDTHITERTGFNLDHPERPSLDGAQEQEEVQGSETDLLALLNKRKGAGGMPIGPAAPRKRASRERKAEQARRFNEYRRVAMQALAVKHRDDYEELYVQARAYVDEQRGPLPD